MADPYQEICPDYALPEFEEAQLIFTLDGKTKEEAVIFLRNLWNVKNTRDIEIWDCQRAADAEAERQL